MHTSDTNHFLINYLLDKNENMGEQKKFLSVLYPKGFNSEGEVSDFEVHLIVGKSITLRYIGELPITFNNPDRTRSRRHQVRVVPKGSETPKNNRWFIVENEDVTFNIGDLVVYDFYHKWRGHIISISPKRVTISDGSSRNKRITFWEFCEGNYTFSEERYNRNHDDHSGRYLYHPDDELYK